MNDIMWIKRYSQEDTYQYANMYIFFDVFFFPKTTYGTLRHSVPHPRRVYFDVSPRYIIVKE